MSPAWYEKRRPHKGRALSLWPNMEKLDRTASVLLWYQSGTSGGTVAVNLSIKNVPDELAGRLRAQAARNHRSIQGELMAILEQALASERRLDAKGILEKVRKLKLSTGDEATAIIRTDRDGR